MKFEKKLGTVQVKLDLFRAKVYRRRRRRRR